MKASVSADERALKIMAYADGELAGDERAEVEQWLKEDAEAVLFANDVAELGDILKIGHKPLKIDLTDAIMAKVEASKVVPISGAKKTEKTEKKSTLVRNVAWIATGFALAASVFLVTRGKDEAPMARTTSPLVQPAENAANVAGQVAAAASAGTVNVENTGSSVSVIYAPTENGSTNVTVWVDESGGK
jgi:anti-sigma factor RsiW